MRMRHIPWAIALVCCVLGFMLSMQFKVQQQVRLEDQTAFMRQEELAKQLTQAESARDALSTELENLRKEMTKAASTQQGNEVLAQQLAETQVKAGLVPISGQGVIVEMKDAPSSLVQGGNPNAFIIHDVDVLRTVNELFGAKAEAISINEQRLIGRTEIRCAGPVITINGVRTAPPVIIKAIGNPDALEGAIMMKDGIAEDLRNFGISVTVRKENTLTVPAFKGSMKLEYGKPAEEVSKP